MATFVENALCIVCEGSVDISDGTKLSQRCDPPLFPPRQGTLKDLLIESVTIMSHAQFYASPRIISRVESILSPDSVMCNICLTTLATATRDLELFKILVAFMMFAPRNG